MSGPAPRIRPRLSAYVLMLALFAVGLQAQARGSVPIVDHRDVAVTTGSGKAVTAQQVGAAIAAALDNARAEGNYAWARVPAGEGYVGTLRVRSKHTIRVDITYSADRYSVLYKDSDNMNYEMKKKGPVIHPYYNTWVRGLVDAINAELARL
ncbi:MAG: hypothetical protein HC872_01435 [Gammaproteobacteria bacterium]|nr:hypothetical protein [Gammaproteobacteria bacterium]